MPKRIQLSRKKGFKLPADAVNVARPTRWGNPFKVGDTHTNFRKPLTATEAVALYRQRLFTEAFATDLRIALDTLRGHDLACWCPLGLPCHADVLLEVVNDPRAEPLRTIRKGEPFVIMGDLCKADRIPDSLGWGSFEFSSADDSNSTAGVYHSGMGPVYSPAVLDLCAGKPLTV